MGNMKFDGPDVTFELDGFDALAERVRSKKINCKINPSDLPRLYAVMDAELESNEELSAAFAEAQEAAFNNAVLAVWAERIKSFKDSFIPVFGDACKDAACRFGFSKDGSNTFKSAVDAFAANICDLYGAAPQIVDGFCEFLARNACLEFDGYAADMPVPCQLYVAEGISKMAYQQAMNSVRGFKLDTDASVEFAEKFINDNVTTPDSFMHLNDACVAIENVMAATSTAAVPETAAEFEDAVAQALAAQAQPERTASPAPAVDADTTGILPAAGTDYPVGPDRAAEGPDRAGEDQQDAYRDVCQGEGAGYAREQGDYARPGTYGDAAGSQYGAYDRYDQDAYGSTYKQGY